MEILALDLATRTGWAHTTAGSGFADFELKRGESPGMRWIKARKWLMDFFDQHQTDLMVYEHTIGTRNMSVARVLHSLVAIAEAAATERGIEVSYISVSALKKWATGKGTASKDQMMDAAEKRAKRVFNDDNEADAYLLMCMAQEQFG